MEVERLLQVNGAEPDNAETLSIEKNVDSLSTLLTQGLRSQDQTLIGRCISTADEDIINQTVCKLEATDAATLLEAAVTQLKSNVNKKHSLALWIRSVLINHTAYLMSTPGHRHVLSSLQQTIDSRLALQRPLSALTGRLDLLMAHANKAKQQFHNTTAPSQPMVMSDESDDSDLSE